MDDKIKMVFPYNCPHCNEPVIIDLNFLYPTIDIVRPADASDEIKKVIENNDTTEGTSPY